MNFEELFGDRVSADTKFVRDQDHLALDSPAATGHRLTAFEALDAFGPDKIIECLDLGSAILPVSLKEPSASLKDQRERLGLNPRQVARWSGVSEAEVLRAETSTLRTPIRTLEKIASTLGLDERYLSLLEGSGRDEKLSVRLRTMRKSQAGFSQNDVIVLSRAAWVIRAQARLQGYFGVKSNLPDAIRPSSDYGAAKGPAWQRGYALASKARQALSISENQPIESLRELLLGLGIPFVSVSLPSRFAGATISVGTQRGIVINTVGDNENVWVRRSTIAHELGHLMWDPPSRLEGLRVDSYAALANPRSGRQDDVEARANAFAIEFLAPGRAVEKVFSYAHSESDGLGQIMSQFGISITAARFHIGNTLSFDASRVKLDEAGSVSPSFEWIGRESYTNEYFPLPETSQPRRGEFAGWVVAAERAHFISEQTAASYLESSLEDYRSAVDGIASLFPEIAQKVPTTRIPVHNY